MQAPQRQHWWSGLLCAANFLFLPSDVRNWQDIKLSPLPQTSLSDVNLAWGRILNINMLYSYSVNIQNNKTQMFNMSSSNPDSPKLLKITSEHFFETRVFGSRKEKQFPVLSFDSFVITKTNGPLAVEKYYSLCRTPKLWIICFQNKDQYIVFEEVKK